MQVIDGWGGNIFEVRRRNKSLQARTIIYLLNMYQTAVSEEKSASHS